MALTEKRVVGYIQQRLRLFEFKLNTLESIDLEFLDAADEENFKFLVRALIKELTTFSRVCNPQIPTAPDDDHAVCSLPLDPPEQGRYLCVYFGFNVFCIDLKNKSIIDDPEQLFQIAPIQLLQKGLPVSMGMFKLNSHTYMVGGLEFCGYDHQPNPWNLRFFEFLHRSFDGWHGISHHTFHLSLSGDALSLGLTPCDFIRPLNKCKVWPIVERIGDKIHVIDSYPLAFSRFLSDTEPSHEFLDCHDIARGWVEIPIVLEVKKKEKEKEEEHVRNKRCYYDDDDASVLCLMNKIWNHIVVGDRIYARPDQNKKSFMMFESKQSKWVLCDYKSKKQTRDSSFGRNEYYGLEKRLSSINHVSQILQYNGCARCFATSLSYGGGGGSSSIENLYVLIALFPDDDLKIIAKAYLVNPMGQILIFQPLPDIFEKFGKAFEGRNATLINVDEHTMCAIVHGFTADLPKYDDDGVVQFADASRDHFLLISSFNVEEVGGADIDVASLSLNEDDLRKLPAAVEKVFVKVDVKDVYAYRKDMESDPPKVYGSYDKSDYACVSACVL